MKNPVPTKSRVIYEGITFYDLYSLFAISLILALITVFLWVYCLFFK
ncbi:hypothetical protein phiPLPE_50 [Iodobacter phage PhiPLPE]|uniref:Uncharacterized protein n=1 Tax=Iodobacter phage PhiPLPE TaxID=551895 RepID=B5AX69_9CAUD|nr:hypothetical protein phiPLPE_50 [Iodobacter phage PhiPLPE]ACG60372.1 hypothetical protein phiPLPE_50 [Iodobacter phage PhiPLPE]